jgi:O-acetyl-ADP-ribose deacetylase (regulator of RNase III)
MAAATEQPRSPLVTYVEGDATTPQGDGLKIITHCCNNVGGWGAGFVVALSRKWDRPEAEYRKWYERHGDVKFRTLLGAMQLVPVEADISVANIIGQHGLRSSGGETPIRYQAISKGFRHIASYATQNLERNVSVHMPRIGCGLAGGSWSQIEPLIDKQFVARGIPVTVYDFPGGKFNP